MRTKLTLAFAFFALQFSFAKMPTVVDPVAPNLADLIYCDPNNDGFGTFDLTVQNPAVLAAQTGSASDYEISYHETLTQANTGSSPIASPYYNINPFSQTIYYRVRNITTSLFAVGTFHIVVNVRPIATTPENILTCDDNNDGFQLFDFTQEISQILGALNPASNTVTFYTSQSLANAGVSPIISINSYIGSNGQTIWVRVEDNVSGCYDLTHFNLVIIPRPLATGPQFFSSCDDYVDPSDGIAALNLTQYAPAILNGQNPSNYQIHYFPTQADAVNFTNQISLSSAQNFVTGSTTVWVKVVNSTGCDALTTININITPYPNPMITSTDNRSTICVHFITGNVVQSLTLDSNVINPSAYTFQWYQNGVALAGANSSTYMVNTSSPTGTTRDYSVEVTSNNALQCNSTSQAFAVIQSGQAVVPPGTNGYTITNLSGVQSITAYIIGYGIYQYSLDAGPQQISNVFDNVSYGIHIINVWDTEGDCDPLIIGEVFIEESAIPAPTGLISQTLAAGSTLANIAINGTNVQWYASANNKNSFSLFSTPLPLNTVLVDGITYYATQTVGGIESIARLPVTVHIALGIGNNEILPIQYAPNPVKSNLTMQSTVVLKTVSIYTMLGQKVFSQNYNDTNISIDLSRLTTGNYILKAQSETGQKTLRIIKE